MSGRQSHATVEALRLVAKGMTPYAAAKRQGIALTTIYRALRRMRERGEPDPRTTASRSGGQA